MNNQDFINKYKKQQEKKIKKNKNSNIFHFLPKKQKTKGNNKLSFYILNFILLSLIIVPLVSIVFLLALFDTYSNNSIQEINNLISVTETFNIANYNNSLYMISILSPNKDSIIYGCLSISIIFMIIGIIYNLKKGYKRE